MDGFHPAQTMDNRMGYRIRGVKGFAGYNTRSKYMKDIPYFNKNANVDLHEAYLRMEQDKKNAVLKILKVLKNPMMVMSKPNRDEVLTLAEEHGIMAKDLIEVWLDLAMRA